MALPTKFDHDLAEIDTACSILMTRIRTWHHAGPNRNPAPIREALIELRDKVTDLVNGPDQRS